MSAERAVSQPDPAGPRRLDALRGSLAAAWPALVAYAAARASGLVVYFLWAHATGRDAVGLLGTRADAAHYVAIATGGYPSAEKIAVNDMAFFPLHPALMRVLDPVLPGGMSTAGVLLTWLASLLAAWGLYAVGAHLHDRRTGVLLAALWGLLPHSIVLSMGYTEALFTALAAWTLLATLRRQWLAAGLLSLLAGLTRPTASALFPVVMLAAFVAITRRREAWWRPLAGLLLAPLGWLGYLAWVGWRTGRIDGWFHIQNEGWKSSWDAGRYTARTTLDVLSQATALDYYLVALVMVVAVALFALSVIDRQPWQLLMFSALMLAVTLGGAGYYHSKARFLLPAFALLLPVAGALARTRSPKMIVVLGTLAAVSAYCGGYLLLIWRLSP